jgi:hypothetical protein
VEPAFLDHDGSDSPDLPALAQMLAHPDLRLSHAGLGGPERGGSNRKQTRLDARPSRIPFG